MECVFKLHKWYQIAQHITCRRSAGELLIAEPLLSGIKKFGHDLDKALAKGITSFVSLSCGFICIIHSRQ